MNDYRETLARITGELEKTIGTVKQETHGDPGLFAHVFAGMLREYLQGVFASKRKFEDTDAFAVLELMKLARSSVSPNVEHSSDAAGYALLRAAYEQMAADRIREAMQGQEANPAPGANAEPINGHSFAEQELKSAYGAMSQGFSAPAPDPHTFTEPGILYPKRPRVCVARGLAPCTRGCAEGEYCGALRSAH